MFFPRPQGKHESKSNHYRRNEISIIKKAPAIKTCEVHLEEPVNELLDNTSRFIVFNPVQVVNYVLERLLKIDPECPKRSHELKSAAHGRTATTERPFGRRHHPTHFLFEYLVASRSAAAIQLRGILRIPFHAGNLFFESLFRWARTGFLVFNHSRIIPLCIGPYTACSNPPSFLRLCVVVMRVIAEFKAHANLNHRDYARRLGLWARTASERKPTPRFGSKRERSRC